MRTYTQVHTLLLSRRGRAGAHACISCGGPARDWAYQYNGAPTIYDADGRAYSEDIHRCYAPMCTPCHKRFDLASDPRLRETARAGGATQAQRLAARRESDPEFAAKMKAVGQRLGKFQNDLRQSDPGYAARMEPILRENMQVALQSTRDRMDDPEFAAKVSHDRAAAARKANAIRRTCDECGLTAHPAGVGAHQKGSGHRGYTDVRGGALLPSQTVPSLAGPPQGRIRTAGIPCPPAQRKGTRR